MCVCVKGKCVYLHLSIIGRLTSYRPAEEGSSVSEEGQIHLLWPSLSPFSAQVSMGRPAGKGESYMNK